MGTQPPKFSAHVYYSYCNFVRTLHRHYWFVQVQVLVFYAFYFLESLIVLSLVRYAQLHRIATIAEVGVAN